MTTRRSLQATKRTACLAITLSAADAAATVGLSGELDLACESAMADTAEQLRTVRCRAVVLDVARVRFCDAGKAGEPLWPSVAAWAMPGLG